MDKMFLSFKVASVFALNGIKKIRSEKKLTFLIEEYKEELNKIPKQKWDYNERSFYDSILNDIFFLNASIRYVLYTREIRLKKGNTYKRYFLRPSANWSVEVTNGGKTSIYPAFKNRRELVEHIRNLKGWEMK